MKILKSYQHKLLMIALAVALTGSQLSYAESATVTNTASATATTEAAPSNDANYELKYKIQQSLGRASPMTLVGPITVEDLILDGDTNSEFTAELIKPKLFGMVAIDNITLQMRKIDEALYQVTPLGFPNKIDLGSGVTLQLNTDFSGEWSFADKSYKQLSGGFTDIHIAENDMPLIDIEVLQLDISADSAGASSLRISAENIIEHVAGNAIGHAEIRASAESPEGIDLHQQLSEVLTQLLINQDMSSVQKILTSLANKRYDEIQLQAMLNDVELDEDLTPNDENFYADTVDINLSLADVTPEQWGESKLAIELEHALLVDGEYAPLLRENIAESWAKLIDTPYDYDAEEGLAIIDDAIKIDHALLELNADQIQLSEILESLRWTFDDNNHNNTIKLSTFYDALLGHNQFSLKLSLRDYDLVADQLIAGLDTQNSLISLNGFDSKDGQITHQLDWDGAVFRPRDTEDLSVKDVGIYDEIFKPYFPTKVKYRTNIDNLHLDLLYKLAEQSEIRHDSPIGALPIAAYALSIEPQIKTEMDWVSEQLTIRSNSDIRLALAEFGRIQSGRAHTSAEGLPETIQHLREHVIQLESVDPEIVEFIAAMLSIPMAYALPSKVAGDNALHWETIIEPKLDGADMTINGYPVYANELPSMMPIFSPSIIMALAYGYYL